MSPVRGREGREKSRQKQKAAGVVPQLNARRRAAKARAAERESATAAEIAALPPSPTESDHDAESPFQAVAVASPTPTTGDEASGFTIGASDLDIRLDQFLAAKLEGVSRSRVQLLIEQDKVALTSAAGAAIKPRASHKLQPGEQIQVLGHARPRPLRAMAEDIPLDILYEDEHMAVINKPAGMMVHAGSGNEPEDERGKGTLVNALLHHLSHLSQSPHNPADDADGQHDLRPGIVHRLDKATSGVLVVAKSDAAHARLAQAFAERTAKKHYIALVQGEMKQNSGTVNTPISRDVNRRTRMTTRRSDGRSAVTHWKVRERLDTAWGKYTLLDVTIETGRTHQIRVHMSSIGHPVVGDTLYGAASEMKPSLRNAPHTRRPAALHLDRNFLHAESLALPHPASGRTVEWHAPLPPELEALLRNMRGVK